MNNQAPGGSGGTVIGNPGAKEKDPRCPGSSARPATSRVPSAGGREPGHRKARPALQA